MARSLAALRATLITPRGSVCLCVCVQAKDNSIVVLGFSVCLFKRHKYSLHRELLNNYPMQCTTAFIVNANFQSLEGLLIQ